jgi:outer membrane protein OmpA-like peptidoglycan-associated protein
MDEAGVEKEQAFTKSDLPVNVAYHESVPYEHWMNGANLKLVRSYEGCCGDTGEEEDDLGQYNRPPFNFTPSYIYVQPQAEEKVRDVVHEATVYFPVNSTKLDPKYLDNPAALQQIEDDINEVRNNKDYSMQSIELKSASSPEGRYDHNAKLAEGRVNAIKDYIGKKMELDDNVLTTTWEAENLEGLRAWIGGSGLPDRDEMLDILNSNAEPDEMEASLRRQHSSSWAKIMKECMPKLRLTTYRVAYGVRQYEDPQEILEMVKTQPEDLSLEEFYIAASALKPGSLEFIEVNRAALERFPEDEIANLNAANAEMEAGNLVKAGQLLKKAGKSPEANYARGVYYCLLGEYSSAKPYVDAAAEAGIQEAIELQDELDR